MNRTPILRKLRDNGATLYVFPSASEDIGLNLNSRATGVAMSHYALLNLPDLNVRSKYSSGTASTDEAVAIATDLQNYVMNMETVLLNSDDYNYQAYHTVSERVFWHWLITRLGKLTFDLNISGSDKSSNFYKTEKFIPTGLTIPNKIVQCFGSIDAGNSLSTEFGMFNETYVNIPSSYGNGPVFFKQSLDASETNYIYGKQYTVNTTENPTVLLGRGDKLDTIKMLDNTTPIYDANNNTYTCNNAYEIVKDLTEIQSALREYTGNDNIVINSYDDVNIDNNNLFKNTIFDITTNLIEFGFNAILLYYSVYDLNDMTKSAYAINLFGIVFLDSPSTSTHIIEELKKKKSFGSFTGGNFFGNSYSFRVNLKTMSVYDNTDAVIQDNTTMSSIASVDFSDVVSNLNRAIDVMNTNVLSTMAILDNYMLILINLNNEANNIDDLSTKINSVINGSRTSSLSTNLLRVNEVRAEDTESNTIKITLNRRLTDYLDTSTYTGTTYIPPIIITNDYENNNVPTVYKPMMQLAETAQGEWADTIGNTNLIIDGITINYYTYQGKTYPNITLPESNLVGLGLDNIYKTGADIDSDDEDILNVKYINYDGLIPLMITYIKLLRAEIDALKNNS